MPNTRHHDIAGIAAWLLGRPLTPADGVPAAELARAEQAVGMALPVALRAFYLAVGREQTIGSSFQRFADPDQWIRLGDKLVFLQENQGVCHWAADAGGRVYQATDLEAPEWHEEPVDLAAFIRVVLYYQMAQGGYPCAGMLSLDHFTHPQAVQALIGDMGGQPVVDMSGLRIFAVAPQVLVWHFHTEGALAEPGLFLSALHEEAFQRLCDRWGFDDLG